MTDPHPADLDQLIGELRQESARRRAEPTFPLEEEAALNIQLERQAPIGGRPRLLGLAEMAQAIADAGPQRRKLTDQQLRQLAGLLAGALRAATDRIADLERRLQILEARIPPDSESDEA